MKIVFPRNSLNLLRASRLAILLCLFHVPRADARTWTDTKGRGIDADLVRIEETAAIVNRGGKELRLPLEMLSETDKQFLEQWRKDHGANPGTGGGTSQPAGNLTLDGKPIEKGGKMNLIERPLSAEAVKALQKDKDNKDTTLKLAVAVPRDFNPAVPQKYFFVVTAVNSEAERASGNISKFGMYSKSCVDAGWVCLAVDSNAGKPKTGWAMWEALSLLEKEWGGFKSGTFATGGFSGGAKGCWWEAAYLAKNKFDVAGVFMGGCNEDRSETNRKEQSAPSAAFRKIRGYVSMGKADTTATIAHSEAVLKSLKSNGIRDLKSGVHDGGHSFHKPHFEEALKWFAEPRL